MNKKGTNSILTYPNKRAYLIRNKVKLIIILLYILIISCILKYKQIHNNHLFNYNLSTDKKFENEKFFFLKEIGQLKYCKNYGLLIYNYPTLKPKPILGNIGDYIQSLAALQYLPKKF